MDNLHYPNFARKVKESGINRFNVCEVAQVMDQYLTDESLVKLFILAHAAPTKEEFDSLLISFANGFAPFPAEGEFSSLNSVFDEIEAICA